MTGTQEAGRGIPVIRAEAEEHNDDLKTCLARGPLDDGTSLNPARRRYFRQEVSDFRKSDYPELIPRVLAEASCRDYGHVCPVFFVARPLTETRARRTHGRSIPRDVMLKVVRRDGQICQKCHEPVPDPEVEFDHTIPFSGGGRLTVDNLRVVHRVCNRKQGNALGDLLHPSPIEHLL